MTLPRTGLSIALLLAAVGNLAAADSIGPFRWARWLLDPANPQPYALPRDPAQAEVAEMLSGDSTAGVIRTLQWQGSNQAGGISFAGNVFLAPVGTTWWIGTPTWDIQRGLLATTGTWTYTRRLFQDWRLHVGYCARDAASLAAVHGGPSKIGSSGLGVDAIVLELDARWTNTSATAWTFGNYNGNPPTCGVWSVPAGLSINAAQANPANKLADLSSFLAGTTPRNGVYALDFRVGDNGAWSLALDRDGDGTADVTTDSAQTGAKPNPFIAITGQSGLMLSLEASAANGLGSVGRTPLDLSYRRSSTSPPPNTGPSITAPATATSSGFATALAASASDDGGATALRWEWLLPDLPTGASVVAGPAPGQATLRVQASGTYRVRSRVIDAAGLSAHADTLVTITAVPSAVVTGSAP